VKLFRRRDHALVHAEILRPGEDTSLPVLLIEGIRVQTVTSLSGSRYGSGARYVA
jgi:hypothetical protein